MSASHFFAGAILTVIGTAAFKFANKYFTLNEVEKAKPISQEIKEAIKETVIHPPLEENQVRRIDCECGRHHWMPLEKFTEDHPS